MLPVLPVLNGSTKRIQWVHWSGRSSPKDFQIRGCHDKKTCFGGIVVVWIVSLAFDRVFCIRSYVSLKHVHLLFTSIIMYINIFIVAKRQENRIHQGTASDGSVAEKKVAKNIFAVVGFTPFFIYLNLLAVLLTKLYNTLHYLHYLQHSTILRFCFLFTHTKRERKKERTTYYI